MVLLQQVIQQGIPMHSVITQLKQIRKVTELLESSNMLWIPSRWSQGSICEGA